MEIPKVSGSYIILSKLHVEMRIGSGPFTGRLLPAGIYFYSGSALGPGGLNARVGRHLRSDTKKHWHFDHIKEHLNIFEVLYATSKESLECQFIKTIWESGIATFPVIGFGSSDCCNQCPAHLVHLPMDADLALIDAKLNQITIVLQRVPINKSDRIEH